MASQDKIKAGWRDYEPPMLTDEEIRQLRDEGARAGAEFRERTKAMEMLTAEDLRVRIR